MKQLSILITAIALFTASAQAADTTGAGASFVYPRKIELIIRASAPAAVLLKSKRKTLTLVQPMRHLSQKN
jgi:hypothetical protein